MLQQVPYEDSEAHKSSSVRYREVRVTIVYWLTWHGGEISEPESAIGPSMD